MTSLLKTASVSTRAKASFPVRHLKFDFSTSRRYWFGNDPYTTHLMNAMSTVFPRGELMLINALRQLRTQIDDPVLQAEMSAFIGQEAIHAREHMAFNRYADEQGIDLTVLEHRVDALYRLMQRFMPNQHIMAVGCAIEHITATFGNELLRRPDWNQRMEGPVGELWLWHALEETEHKAVFFDAYTAAGGGYALRTGYMALAASSLAVLIASGWMRLLRNDRQLQPRRLARFFWDFAGPGGLANRTTVGNFFDYFRLDFHPDDHDTDQLEQDWRDALRLTAA